MNQYYYKIALAVLVITSLLLIIAKISGIGEADSVVTNYIGDMESENQNLTSDSNIEEEQEQGDGVELEERTQVRVLIKDTGFHNTSHETLTACAPSGLEITFGEEVMLIEGGEEFHLEIDDEMFEEGTILIQTIAEDEKITITSIERGYGEPEYYGVLEVFQEEDGLVIINDLELEYYLRGVLPSEMPASFELEALKAQAVCARSYAYNHMASYSYPEYSAHIDDSVSYQVYNNSSESDICNQAIEETKDEKLTYNGKVVTTYFYSTSSGYTTDVSAWGSDATSDAYGYLQSTSVSDGETDYEEDLPWYRWSVTVSEEVMQEILEENLDIELGEIQSLEVTEVGAGGVALVLEIVGEVQTVEVENEYRIRKALGSDAYDILKNDGNVVSGSSLLPSAFFEITYKKGVYTINGGGYGHGIGMSQNGANEMAKDGYTYNEILEFFYTGTVIS